MASQTSCSTFVVNSVTELKAALRQEFGKGVRVRLPRRGFLGSALGTLAMGPRSCVAPLL
jgi:hypothetical protein